MIDIYSRYQKGLVLNELFPQFNKEVCACGCGKLLSSKQKKWASIECRDAAAKLFLIVKGDVLTIRKELYNRDKGKCAYCGETTLNWEADHILPVFKGGGGCDLDNFQTLCLSCHKIKTSNQIDSHHKAISLQADSI